LGVPILWFLFLLFLLADPQDERGHKAKKNKKHNLGHPKEKVPFFTTTLALAAAFLLCTLRGCASSLLGFTPSLLHSSLSLLYLPS